MEAIAKMDAKWPGSAKFGRDTAMIVLRVYPGIKNPGTLRISQRALEIEQRWNAAASSVRRALRNLAHQALVEKCSPLGQRNTYWRLSLG